MKRILLTIVVLLIASTMVYAQQRNSQNQTQASNERQKFLDEAKSNNSEFQDNLANLKDRNGHSGSTYTFNRLKSEIVRLENTINSETKSINTRLEKDTRVNSEVITRLEKYVNQHTTKVEELDELLSSK